MTVDKSKIQEYLAKKEKDKKKDEVRKKKEKEELIKLRIAAQGGKVSGKMANIF